MKLYKAKILIRIAVYVGQNLGESITYPRTIDARQEHVLDVRMQGFIAWLQNLQNVDLQR